MRERLGPGAVIGVVLSIVSWNGNRSSGSVSTFPDALTLVTLPVLVYLTLWVHARGKHLHDSVALRRAGLVIVTWAAIVFAVFVTALSVVRFTHPAFPLLAFGFVTTLAATLAIGALSSALASRLVIRQIRGSTRSV